MNILTTLFENQQDNFDGEDLSFPNCQISQNGLPWRPCFTTNQHGLNQSDRCSKETFRQMHLKIGLQVREENNLKECLMVPKEMEGIGVKMSRGCEISSRVTQWFMRRNRLEANS